MYYEDEKGGGALNFIAGLAIGAIVGASVALLTAPQAGKRTRRQIVRVVANAKEASGDEWERVSGQVRRAVRRRRRRARR